MNQMLLIISVLVAALATLAFFLLQGKKNGGNGKSGEAALKPAEYQPFKLLSRDNITHNTVLFRFGLKSPTQRLGLPIGQHLLLRFMDADNKPISRPYTPVSSDDDLGHFDLLIKLYPTGKMSQHLAKMQPGESIDVRGPQGSLEYKGKGLFEIARRGGKKTYNTTSVGMIAGGSGITPMLQVLKAVDKGGVSDSTKVNLIFANVTEEDILCRQELESLSEKRSLTDVFYTLDKPSASWTKGTGFVTTEMIKQHLPPPSTSTLVLLCGPKPMVDMMEKHLASLGYTEDMYFKF